MGLLEKVKQQKQTTLESEAVLDLDASGQNLQKKEKSSGLLEKAKQKKQNKYLKKQILSKIKNLPAYQKKNLTIDQILKLLMEKK